jgi:hypothetical protein
MDRVVWNGDNLAEVNNALTKWTDSRAVAVIDHSGALALTWDGSFRRSLELGTTLQRDITSDRGLRIYAQG